LQTETALKKFFRTEKLLLLPKDYEDKFDGYSETWDRTEVQFNSADIYGHVIEETAREAMESLGNKVSFGA
tara:strand:- start:2518 stop:2730 length:213 start_codon:yes stop_codon:yes gene_type:complete